MTGTGKWVPIHVKMPGGLNEIDDLDLTVREAKTLIRRTQKALEKHANRKRRK